MKKTFLALLGLSILLTFSLVGCKQIEPEYDTYAARPVLDWDGLPEDMVIYLNQTSGEEGLSVDGLVSGVDAGTTTFRWRRSVNAGGVGMTDITATIPPTTYPPEEPKTYQGATIDLSSPTLSDVGVRYYSVRVTNTEPGKHKPANIESPVVKVEVRDNFADHKIFGQGEYSAAGGTKTTHIEFFITGGPAPGRTMAERNAIRATIAKENIDVYSFTGKAKIGDGALDVTDDATIRVPINVTASGEILFRVKGVAGVEECFYRLAVSSNYTADSTNPTYTVIAYNGNPGTRTNTSVLRFKFTPWYNGTPTITWVENAANPPAPAIPGFARVAGTKNIWDLPVRVSGSTIKFQVDGIDTTDKSLPVIFTPGTGW